MKCRHAHDGFGGGESSLDLNDFAPAATSRSPRYRNRLDRLCSLLLRALALALAFGLTYAFLTFALERFDLEQALCVDHPGCQMGQMDQMHEHCAQTDGCAATDGAWQ